MTAEELAQFFASLNGAIDQYPEVWEAKSRAGIVMMTEPALLVVSKAN